MFIGYDSNKSQQKIVELEKVKIQFVRMRKTIGETDNSLSIILVMNTLKTIYSVLFIIYTIFSMNNHPEMKALVQVMAYTTTCSVVELILSCFVCGSLHETSDKIYAILDAFDANKLSEFEYKEWLMFKNVSKKTPFGFTIGGFASLKKTTLIAVCISMY